MAPTALDLITCTTPPHDCDHLNKSIAEHPHTGVGAASRANRRTAGLALLERQTRDNGNGGSELTLLDEHPVNWCYRCAADAVAAKARGCDYARQVMVGLAYIAIETTILVHRLKYPTENPDRADAFTRGVESKAYNTLKNLTAERITDAVAAKKFTTVTRHLKIGVENEGNSFATKKRGPKGNQKEVYARELPDSLDELLQERRLEPDAPRGEVTRHQQDYTDEVKPMLQAITDARNIMLNAVEDLPARGRDPHRTPRAALTLALHQFSLATRLKSGEIKISSLNMSKLNIDLRNISGQPLTKSARDGDADQLIQDSLNVLDELLNERADLHPAETLTPLERAYIISFTRWARGHTFTTHTKSGFSDDPYDYASDVQSHYNATIQGYLP